MTATTTSQHLRFLARTRGTRVSMLSLAIVLLIAAACSAIAVKAVGESPWSVLKILAASSLGSAESVSYTLFYATPLLLTGLAVALPLQAGLFNIGAEGQLYMGAVAAAAWAAVCARFIPATGGAPAVLTALAWLGGIVVAFTGGALWGGLAGYLRTRRSTHEVIATIMLNFIAMAFANWAILYPLKNPETQSIETRWIPEALRVPPLWQHTTWGLPMAVTLAIAVLWAVQRTWWGYRVRVAGQNMKAATLAGIPLVFTCKRGRFDDLFSESVTNTSDVRISLCKGNVT